MKYCFLLLVVFLCLLKIQTTEGYMYNRPPSDKPDDVQFYACHDYSSSGNLGNTNYKIHQHGVGEPLQGTYSHFLNAYNLRNYDELFHSPICQGEYNFENIVSLGFRPIIDNQDENTSELLENERELDLYAIKDPYYVYLNPDYIENTLLYSEDINRLFLKNHRSHDAENLSHRIDYETIPR